MSTWFTIALCLAAFMLLGLALLRWGFVVVRVRGSSMLPAFQSGDRVLVRTGRRSGLRVGTVVLLRSPFSPPPEHAPWSADTRMLASPWIIKRVAALPGDAVPENMRAATGGIPVVPNGLFMVSADNPDGTDSRQLGFMPISDILGTAVSPRRRTLIRQSAPTDQTR